MRKKHITVLSCCLALLLLLGGAVLAFSDMQADPASSENEDVKMEIGKVNDEVNKITLTWGEKPNAGYTISILRIDFDAETSEATISYQLGYPEPDRMYAEVITTPTAETYVAGMYTPILKQVENI
jgi:hypothetical protein